MEKFGGQISGKVGQVVEAKREVEVVIGGIDWVVDGISFVVRLGVENGIVDGEDVSGMEDVVISGTGKVEVSGRTEEVSGKLDVVVISGGGKVDAGGSEEVSGMLEVVVNSGGAKVDGGIKLVERVEVSGELEVVVRSGGGKVEVGTSV